jgi:hypothetical protein
VFRNWGGFDGSDATFAPIPKFPVSPISLPTDAARSQMWTEAGRDRCENWAREVATGLRETNEWLEAELDKQWITTSLYYPVRPEAYRRFKSHDTGTPGAEFAADAAARWQVHQRRAAHMEQAPEIYPLYDAA